MSKQGYWKFDGQVKWFVKYVIPMSRDLSWRAGLTEGKTE